MPLQINDFHQLKAYAEGVMSRADHHAQSVNGIALTLLGAILWRAEGNVEVFGSSGPAGNVLWARISGIRYAFSYDHDQEVILMKEKSTQGPVLHRFDNSTPPALIDQIFRNL